MWQSLFLSNKLSPKTLPCLRGEWPTTTVSLGVEIVICSSRFTQCVFCPSLHTFFWFLHLFQGIWTQQSSWLRHSKWGPLKLVLLNRVHRSLLWWHVGLMQQMWTTVVATHTHKLNRTVGCPYDDNNDPIGPTFQVAAIPNLAPKSTNERHQSINYNANWLTHAADG